MQTYAKKRTNIPNTYENIPKMCINMPEYAKIRKTNAKTYFWTTIAKPIFAPPFPPFPSTFGVPVYNAEIRKRNAKTYFWTTMPKPIFDLPLPTFPVHFGGAGL